MAIADFALKFGLLLKVFNLGRGRLTQAVGVDKSVMSRWASGVQAPSDHNLTLLTEAVARHRPGFQRRDWDRDIKSFAERLDALGVGAPNLLLDKPSIAVLPFQNISGDPKQEYFVDGLVEDIVTELSKFRELLVTARASSFAYKGRATEIKEVGRNLGVRYVLEGSVRKAGRKVRITGQLIDCETGVHVWADRFDGTLEDVFDLQDRVTSNVVRAIAPAVQFAETERTRRKPTANLDAYDWFLRGSAATWEGHGREAIDHFKKAIEQDERYAEAYGMCAGAYVSVAAFGGTSLSSDEKAEALEFADKAANLGTDDALALARAAHAVVFFGKEYERGSAMIERAVGLNPNLSLVWLSRGWVYILGGDVERAESSFSRVVQFSELDPARASGCCGMSYCCFYLGRYEEGCTWAAKALQKYVNVLYLRPLIMNTLRAGRKDEARKVAARLLQISPNWRTSEIVLNRNVELQTAARAALREAGLPD